MSGTSPGWLNWFVREGTISSVVCAERALGVVLGLTLQSRWVCYLGEGLPAMFLHLLGDSSAISMQSLKCTSACMAGISSGVRVI